MSVVDSVASDDNALYSLNFSDKTTAVTVSVHNERFYAKLEGRLYEKYTFCENKKANGKVVTISEQDKKVVLSLYYNTQTLFIQGIGYQDWMENVFNAMADDISTDIGGNDTASASGVHDVTLSANNGINNSIKSTMEETLSTNAAESLGLENSSNNDDINHYKRLVSEQLKENKELQHSVRELLAQTKLLKTENERVLKLLENSVHENGALRKKLEEQNLKEKENECILACVKQDLSKANADSLVHEEANTKLKNEIDKLTKEKNSVVGQLSKLRVTSENVDAKIENAQGSIQQKVETEISSLKDLVFKELGEIKEQLKCSLAQTSTKITQSTQTEKAVIPETYSNVLKTPISTTKATQSDHTDKAATQETHSNVSKTPISTRAKDNNPPHSKETNHQYRVFIAGDSITKILSTRKMSNSKVNVKIKSHPGGRIRTVERTFIEGKDFSREFTGNYDLIMLHVGTNNIPEQYEDITDSFRDTIETIKDYHPSAKIIVSSILPRLDDSSGNAIIQRTNLSLAEMCDDSGYTFLNNDDIFLKNGKPVRSLYRDNIHLNTKGGRQLGINMSHIISSVLGIKDTLAESNSMNFQTGRNFGRRPAFQRVNQDHMIYVPMPSVYPHYWMDNQFPRSHQIY